MHVFCSVCVMFRNLSGNETKLRVAESNGGEAATWLQGSGSVLWCSVGVSMLAKFADLLFGCWHKHYSFPITTRPGQRRSGAAITTGTYVVCLDCGKEFAYDWKQMKVVSPDYKPAAAIAGAVEQNAA